MFDFWENLLRIILNMIYRWFGRENKRTVIKENNNIVDITMQYQKGVNSVYGVENRTEWK